MSLRSYRELIVWKKSFQLAISSHRLAKQLPRTETFELGSQIRRAAGSVPANIAEGYGRRYRGDYLRHLSNASGSLKELETHLLLATALEYLSHDDVRRSLSLASEVGRLLRALERSLRT